MECPFIRVEESGGVVELLGEVTTVGRGKYVDVRLADPSVSMLHAELIRRGPYVYVTDLGLSRNGTRVNGRLVARRLLADGDVVTFGSARCRIGGVAGEELSADSDLRRPATPELTRRELDVVTSLCRPALSDEAFVAPAAAREIAVDLVVTEAAVKQHLLRLYQKLRIPEGPNRRVRLANEVVALGLVRPLPQAMLPERPAPAAPPAQSGTAAAPSAASAPPPAAPGPVLPHQVAPRQVVPHQAIPQPAPPQAAPPQAVPHQAVSSPAASPQAKASPGAISPATW
jgi:pyruvate/2-oxoglutarate dehydrogenase complex dihydrolipoamide acyltransferase (E2) component